MCVKFPRGGLAVKGSCGKERCHGWKVGIHDDLDGHVEFIEDDQTWISCRIGS